MKKKELFGKIAFGLAALLLPLTLVGCGRNHSLTADEFGGNKGYVTSGMTANYAEPAVADDYYYDDFAYEEADYEYGDTANGGFGSDANLSEKEVQSASEKRKLIRTVNLEVETTEFDATLSSVQDEINRLGGYVANEYTYNGSTYSSYKSSRYATITVRVPDDKLEEFVGSVSGVANVISKSTSTEDVTLQYVDVEGKKAMYEAEEQSLLMLLEKAETVEDISYLVSRLSEVRYNIESMESTLRTYDNLVDYATIQLRVDEVEILTPVEVEEKTIGDQIKEGFDASLKDVLYSLRRTGMNILIDSPYIIRFFVTLGIIVGIIFLAIKITIAIIKKSIKKAKAKKANKLNETSKTSLESEAETVKLDETNDTETKSEENKEVEDKKEE